MAKIALSCPRYGLAMGRADYDAKPGQQQAEPEDHIHVDVEGALECMLGHGWTISGGFVLERTK